MGIFTSSNSDAANGGKKNTKGIPRGDKEFLSLSERVSLNFFDHELTITAISKQGLVNMVAGYKGLLNELYETHVDKDPTVDLIKDEMKVHRDKLKHVKDMLSEEYGKAKSLVFYPEFGIEKENGAYILPNRQETRLIALIKMVTALKRHTKISGRKYGAAFWEKRLNIFQELLGSSTGSSGSIAGSVSEKDIIKSELHQHLTSIRFVVRGNFPKTYKAEWRKLGFLKERF